MNNISAYLVHKNIENYFFQLTINMGLEGIFSRKYSIDFVIHCKAFHGKEI